MDVIRFEVEGPSPSEISRLYCQVDLPPPRLQERYSGEYSDMYRANGMVMVDGVWRARPGITLRQMAASIEVQIKDVDECYMGPLISEDRIVLGGVAWWRPMRAESVRARLTLLRAA
jgi:hypothetical protein